MHNQSLPCGVLGNSQLTTQGKNVLSLTATQHIPTCCLGYSKESATQAIDYLAVFCAAHKFNPNDPPDTIVTENAEQEGHFDVLIDPEYPNNQLIFEVAKVAGWRYLPCRVLSSSTSSQTIGTELFSDNPPILTTKIKQELQDKALSEVKRIVRMTTRRLPRNRMIDQDDIGQELFLAKLSGKMDRVTSGMPEPSEVTQSKSGAPLPSQKAPKPKKTVSKTLSWARRLTSRAQRRMRNHAPLTDNMGVNREPNPSSCIEEDDLNQKCRLYRLSVVALRKSLLLVVLKYSCREQNILMRWLRGESVRSMQRARTTGARQVVTGFRQRNAHLVQEAVRVVEQMEPIVAASSIASTKFRYGLAQRLIKEAQETLRQQLQS